jgi:hypothetical protein
MLCSACSEIFSKPREFGYGNFYPWYQTDNSFRAAVSHGCHLCNLIYEQASYPADSKFSLAKHFGNDPISGVRYAFRPLNANWAQRGKGYRWLSVQHSLADDYSLWQYAADQRTPEIAFLSNILESEPNKLLSNEVNLWMVLEFYGTHLHVALPVELCRGKSTDLPDVICMLTLNCRRET